MGDFLRFFARMGRCATGLVAFDGLIAPAGRAVRLAVPLLGLAAVCNLMVSPASAQAVPGGVTPGAIREEFRPRPTPKPDQRPAAQPTPTEDPSVTCAPGITLQLRSSRIEGLQGSTAVEPARLEALLEPLRKLEGRPVECADVFSTVDGIIDDIQSVYAKAGVRLVVPFIPAGDLDQNAADIVIKVIEGYVAEIKLAGDVDGHSDMLRALTDNIVASRPLRWADLERYLLLANDLPGRKVEATFSRVDGDAPAGAVLMTLKVTHRPVAATLTLNNHGSRAVGPYRAVATAAFNNTLGADERLRIIHARTLKDDELDFFSASLSTVFGSEGLTLEAAGSWSNSIPGYETITPIGIGSDGVTGSIIASYPFVRSRDLNLSGSLSLEATRLLTSNSLSPGTVAREEARIVRLEATLDWIDPWKGFLSATFTQSQGLDALGARLSETALSGTNGARIDFSRSVLRVDRFQRLFDTGTVVLQLSGQGQYAGTRLINSELCGFGGRGFGRGYDSFEVSGDHCVLGAAELQSTPGLGLQWLAGTLYGFADAGYVWRLGNPALNTRKASAGIGLRLQTDTFRANVEYAKPLEGIVAQEGDADGRVFFELGARF